MRNSLVLNIGDMLQRITNGAFISATHRVALPPITDNFIPNPSMERVTPARYSMPFFVAPDDDAKVACLPSLVGDVRPVNYEPVIFSEYGDWVSKYQYERGLADETRSRSEGLET
jgi:isopenicillin N synthase-like dioxygenase